MSMPDKRSMELLRGAGREVSESLLKSAVQTARTDEEMSNQIYVLRWAAINILAHEAYNAAKQNGESFDSYRASLWSEFLEEFKNLCSADDTEYVEINSAPADNGGH